MAAKQKKPVLTAKQQILADALHTLQEALVSKFGDAASNAGSGEGCNFDVRAEGTDLMDGESNIIADTESPEQIAARFYRE